MKNRLWLGLGVLAILPGCVSAKSSVDVVTPLEGVQSSVRFKKEYLLAPGDQIDVVVQRAPEVSRNVIVRPDGFISLSLLGDVAASGLTVRELSAKLKELFSVRLISPEVTVIATQMRQPVVYVTGEVGTPGAVPFRDAPTAMQAIALVGGFRRSAASGDVAIIRLSEDGRLRATRVQVQAGGQPGPILALRGIPLQPDDLIFVPESGRNQMSRFLDDFIARPLASLNGVVGTWVNFRLAEQIVKTNP